MTNATGLIGGFTAATSGGTCGMNWQEIMVVCTGASRMYGGGGTTYGSVFITPRAAVSEKLMRHEAKHADQWATIGPAFGQTYVLTYAVQGECNVWERLAGYGDGGYDQC